MSKFKVGDRVKLDGVHMGEDSFTKVRAARKIIITHDGTTTIARMFEGNKAIKSAEAKCAPSDTFDFSIGAKLAFDRLMDRLPIAPSKLAANGTVQEPIKLYCVKDFASGIFLTRGKVYEFVPGKGITYDDGWCGGDSYGGDLTQYTRGNPSLSDCLVPLVSRPAKIGEWVYATSNDGTSNKIAVNSIYKVTKVWNVGDCVNWIDVDIEKRSTALRYDQYLVLDGYQPEPEYYNGKVVCIKAYGGFTAGKVYCFTDGVCGDNDGDKRPESGRRPISDLSDGWARDIFIEYKGEAQ